MKLYLYNNYTSFAFSFCKQAICETKFDPHYTSFMIFSYPNGTDYNLDLIEYLFKYNNLDNLEIDLKENVRIDNNIFGLVYSNIIIKGTNNNCNNLDLFSFSSNNSNSPRNKFRNLGRNNPINTPPNISIFNKSIGENSTLKEDEKIKVSLKPYSSYNSFECIIDYVYIISEPPFEIYNGYCDRVTIYGEDTMDTYDKEMYESRVLKYSIKVDKDLETQCTDKNCDLCLATEKDYCIICKYNYTIYNGINEIKECFPNPEDIETTVLEIASTQIIDTTNIQIDTTHVQIDTTNVQIDTTQLKIDKTHINEKTDFKID